MTGQFQGRTSYSQTGEDLIMAFVCEVFGIQAPSYLDIGAYHPVELNNSYYFYLQGSAGINVEPNPVAMAQFHEQRPRDKNLSIGIAPQRGTMTYFEFDPPTLNTFSEQEALAYHRLGHKFLNAVPVEVDTVENVLNACGYGKFPELLNLDVEGMELPILQSMDLTEGPILICLETVEYALRLGQGKKRQELTDFLTGRNYRVYADTYINTIYIRKDRIEGNSPG